MMKSLYKYILESLETRTIENVMVTYKASKSNIYVDCPETFQEDDINQYIDDLLLEQLPSNQDIAKKYFGENFKFINDAYFEYDGFERLSYKKDLVDIKYDSALGKDAPADIKTVTFRLKNLRFKMIFSKFNVMLNDDADIDEVITTIFKSYESNDYNKTDVQFKYSDCEYDLG